MYTADTIVAPATAKGKAGINIIRISGENSLEIAKKIFKSKNKDIDIKQNERRLTYGHIVEGEEIIDEVMLCYMKAPHTFTCEDVVEINCHGGSQSVEKIIELVLKNGARIAENGEFTKRAFLNGRIDLSQAEAVIDVINAKSSKSFENAQKQLQGRLSGKIHDIDHKLKESLAKITVAIDFPEEDIPEVTSAELLEGIEFCLERLTKLKQTYNDGKKISEGIKIAIIGKPNVGKSSLLNELLDENRAIVTNIEGTTRDIIEQELSIKGVSVNLVDTAGIRDTSDVIEKIGVERSIDSMQNSDIVLFLLDNSREITQNEIELIHKIQDKDYLILVNKSDLEKNIDLEKIPKFIKKDKIMNISVENKEGIENLKDRIYNMAITYDDEAANSIMLTNARHFNLIEKAVKNLEDAREGINSNLPLDIVETDYNDALLNLGEITGEAVSENLLDTIFSKFCIGK